MVYNGVMAGTDSRKTGGGSEYVCLPKYPQYSTYIARTQHHAKLVPAEYELPVTQNGYQYNVPCAVCKTTRMDTLMIPARTSCYSGWTLEYQGYLETEHDEHSRSTKFICVDKNYDVIPGSRANQHPATHLYHVEVDCSTGNIPCSYYQYNNFKKVTCVVCSS